MQVLYSILLGLLMQDIVAVRNGSLLCCNERVEWTAHNDTLLVASVAAFVRNV